MFNDYMGENNIFIVKIISDNDHRYTTTSN